MSFSGNNSILLVIKGCIEGLVGNKELKAWESQMKEVRTAELMARSCFTSETKRNGTCWPNSSTLSTERR